MRSKFCKFVLPFILIELLAFLFASEVNLQARWFGALVGLVAGVVLWLIRRPAWRFTFWAGYLSGTICDFLYLIVYGSTYQCLLLILWGGLVAVLLKNSVENRFSWGQGFIALGILIVTAHFALPDLEIERRELPEGIYVYANDVVYNIPVLNIISSRFGIMVHTGICYVTRDTNSYDRQRLAAGLPKLDFEPIGYGYSISDLNLEVRDRDCFANYASRTELDDQSFPFDLEHMEYYLAGRSVNDLPKPSIRFVPLNVPNPREAWNRIMKFRKQINAQYRDGFIYSPIAYDGQFVRLYNCNTVTVGIADEFLDRGKEAEILTNLPLNVGSQRIEDGRRLMKDYRKDDFQSRIDQEREFWKTQPFFKQRWLHLFLLRKFPSDENPDETP
ncbi:MAG: hypothetical protein K6C40_14470 [Thermoguttaceae bacterium]|nr:hypothetical protein [Thermoguttaceae bacterium]